MNVMKSYYGCDERVKISSWTLLKCKRPEMWTRDAALANLAEFLFLARSVWYLKNYKNFTKCTVLVNTFEMWIKVLCEFMAINLELSSTWTEILSIFIKSKIQKWHWFCIIFLLYLKYSRGSLPNQNDSVLHCEQT